MSDLPSAIHIYEATNPTVTMSAHDICDENLPVYTLDGPFVPMTPRQNDRYDRAAL